MSASLEGVGVAVTRPGKGSGRLGELLREAGARVAHWPCIRFEGTGWTDAGGRYDWVALTSPRAARYWLKGAGSGRGDTRVAVVGPATGGLLREHGIDPDREAAVHSAAGLVRAFREAGDAAGARVLFPCSDLAGNELPAGLRALGATVDEVIAYRTRLAPPEEGAVRGAVRVGEVEIVTFTSPSTVRGFLAGLSDDGRHEVTRAARSVAIGPTTADALADAGWPGATAPVATLESLVWTVAEAAAGAGPETPPASDRPRAASR